MILDTVKSGDFLDYLKKLVDFSSMIGTAAGEVVEENSEIQKLVTSKLDRRAEARNRLLGLAPAVKAVKNVVAIKKKVDDSWLVFDQTGSKKLGGPYGTEKEADACVNSVVAAKKPDFSSQLASKISQLKEMNDPQKAWESLRGTNAVQAVHVFEHAYPDWKVVFDHSANDYVIEKRPINASKKEFGKVVASEAYNLSRKVTEFVSWGYAYGGQRVRSYAQSVNTGMNAFAREVGSSLYTLKSSAEIGKTMDFGRRSAAEVRKELEVLASRNLDPKKAELIKGMISDINAIEHFIKNR